MLVKRAEQQQKGHSPVEPMHLGEKAPVQPDDKQKTLK